MIEKAYLRFKDGVPASEATYLLYGGFKNRGVEVVPFTDFTEIEDHLTKETLVHGWVGDVRKAAKKLGIREPSLPSIPPGLQDLLGREVHCTTLGHVRNSKAWPIFMKPKEQKLFTGYVVNEFMDLIETSHLPDSTPVYTQPPVTFVSEYRCFMHWDKAVGIRQYNGDCHIFPDTKVLYDVRDTLIRKAVMPCAYSIDLGVLADGRTVLVEINDSFALGAYGLAWPAYLNMVTDRWRELVTEPVIWANHLIDLYLTRRITYHQFQVRFLSLVYWEDDTGAMMDQRVRTAHLIWCEYSSHDRAEEDWFRTQLEASLGPNLFPMWMP